MNATCEKCGQEHSRCSAHVKGSSPLKPCGRQPRTGHKACPAHGGNTPAAEAKAEVVRKTVEARKALARWAEHAPAADIDPVAALLAEFRRTCAVVAYLDGVVGAADFDDVWQDKADRIQLDVRIEWWERERDRLAGLVTGLHKMGIDERRVRVEEAQAHQLVAVIRGVLNALNLSSEQRALVPGIVRAQLAAIMPGSES